MEKLGIQGKILQEAKSLLGKLKKLEQPSERSEEE
jgi:hypothetical protein